MTEPEAERGVHWRRAGPILVVLDQPWLAEELRSALTRRGFWTTEIPPGSGRLRVDRVAERPPESGVLELLSTLERWLRARTGVSLTMWLGNRSYHLTSPDDF